MPSHPTSPAPAHNSWYLGLIYSLITVVSWSTLPLALAVTLKTQDALTVTWFRMLIAALLLGTWLGVRGQLRSTTDRVSWWLSIRRFWPVLLIAALGLIGNYVFYLIGLDFTTPANAQVLIQLAPLCLALGSMVFFNERFNRWQWLGFLILIAGLLLFFRHQLGALGATQRYQLGVVYIAISAIFWAIYALVQKRLMRTMSSMQIMLFIYCTATILMLPTADFLTFSDLQFNDWLWLIFCALNTLIAYAAFGEAMHHWQATRISAVIALTPLSSIGVIFIAATFLPGLVPPEQLNIVSLIAAMMVVIGSVTTSLCGQNRTRVNPSPVTMPTANNHPKG